MYNTQHAYVYLFCTIPALHGLALLYHSLPFIELTTSGLSFAYDVLVCRNPRSSMLKLAL